jgi:hypothetical protein
MLVVRQQRKTYDYALSSRLRKKGYRDLDSLQALRFCDSKRVLAAFAGVQWIVLESANTQRLAYVACVDRFRMRTRL